MKIFNQCVREKQHVPNKRPTLCLYVYEWWEHVVWWVCIFRCDLFVCFVIIVWARTRMICAAGDRWTPGPMQSKGGDEVVASSFLRRQQQHKPLGTSTALPVSLSHPLSLNILLSIASTHRIHPFPPSCLHPAKKKCIIPSPISSPRLISYFPCSLSFLMHLRSHTSIMTHIGDNVPTSLYLIKWWLAPIENFTYSTYVFKQHFLKRFPKIPRAVRRRCLQS